MMPLPPGGHEIKTVQHLKTYAGARFCESERALRNDCMEAEPETVLALNAARRAVQSGDAAEEVFAAFQDRAFNKADDFQTRVQHCLAVIADGGCSIYPKPPS